MVIHCGMLPFRKWQRSVGWISQGMLLQNCCVADFKRGGPVYVSEQRGTRCSLSADALFAERCRAVRCRFSKRTHFASHCFRTATLPSSPLRTLHPFHFGVHAISTPATPCHHELRASPHHSANRFCICPCACAFQLCLQI